MRTLAKYGIHSGSIFPGLDGISKYVEESHFWLNGQKDLDLVQQVLEDTLKDRHEKA